ncbi:hypothetical protein HYX15_01710 [Candidatus Woesearchaeota archaeon]|nr:hypothetical protein [Candidatus Woesearchaeota archaeon]
MIENKVRNNNHISQIEKYEKHPKVCSVLTQDSTFVRHVGEFYDLSTELIGVPRVGLVPYFDVGKENPEKFGKCPTDLIQILEGFEHNKKPLDGNKLVYERVREDYNRWHSPYRKVVDGLKFFGSLAVGAGGVWTALAIKSRGGPDYMAISAATLGITGLISYIKWGFYSEPKGTNHELDEYLRLYRRALNADAFMKNVYGAHFIRKTLKNDRTK